MINQLKLTMEAGTPVFGFWSAIPSPIAANILAAAGPDFVILDTEHAPFSLETLESAKYAIQAADCNPIVRVPLSSAAEILRILDLGFDSLLMSNVSTSRQAQELVLNAHYPPNGNRGLSPFTSVHAYSDNDVAGSMLAANRRLLTGCLVEGPDGLRNIASISKTDGLDLVYIGLYDLAAALGHAGDLNHPEVEASLTKALTQIHAAGKLAGTVVKNIQSLDKFASLGFNFLAYRNDAALLMDQCSTATSEFRLVAGRQ